MVVVCGKCQRKFNLDDAKIPESGVKVRCSKCGFTFLVQKPASAPEEKPQAPEGRPRPAAPSPPSAAPAAAAPKKAAIVPKDEDFADIFQPGDSAPAAPAPEDEFRDLFTESEKPKDTSTEDVFGDIFETSAPEKPAAASPPRVPASAAEPRKAPELEKSAPEPRKAPELQKSAPDPKKAPPVDGLDVEQMGQEFKLDDFGSGEIGGFEAPPPAAGAASAPPARAESKSAPETAKDVPEWGTIKFGEEAAADAPAPELEKTSRPEAPALLPEKPKPAAVPVSPAASAEPPKAAAPAGVKSKTSVALSKSASFLLHASFLIAMVLIFLGVGQRYFLKNPVILRQAGLNSLADDLYYRRITKQRQLLPFAMKTYWMENQARTPVLVIEGKAFNGTGAPLDVSRISVDLSYADGKPLGTRALPIGAPIELEEIRNLSQDELEAQIQRRAAGIHLPPNGEFAFRFPLPGIAVQKLNYRLEVK